MGTLASRDTAWRVSLGGSGGARGGDTLATDTEPQLARAEDPGAAGHGFEVDGKLVLGSQRGQTAVSRVAVMRERFLKELDRARAVRWHARRDPAAQHCINLLRLHPGRGRRRDRVLIMPFSRTVGLCAKSHIL